ncbi:MAG: hypothetical protein ABI181_01420 [Mycobacteriaceae bacterium]
MTHTARIADPLPASCSTPTTDVATLLQLSSGGPIDGRTDLPAPAASEETR